MATKGVLVTVMVAVLQGMGIPTTERIPLALKHANIVREGTVELLAVPLTNVICYI